MAAFQFDAPLVLGAQIEARANHPEVGGRTCAMQGDRRWTYRQLRDESVRNAHLLLRRLGKIDDARPGHVAMLLENHLELLSLYGGCGFAGLTLFGVNTGLRGETLAGVLNQSKARVLVVDQRFAHEVARVAQDLKHVAPENILVLKTDPKAAVEGNDLAKALDAEVGTKPLDAPAVDVDAMKPLMIIYTSGTTGLPKGIKNNHFKFLAIGMTVSGLLQIGPDDVGYACMPLFHSNAMFLGFHPVFHVGGSLAIRERFSASQFAPDVLRYGVSYWNYVGEPMHYILAALMKEYGSEAKILEAVAKNPKNRLRFALGNGASPPDLEKFERWFALEDVFELYGSTEAAISTFRKKGDPRGSVGEVTDQNVKILNERGEECPPATLDADGKITNYAEAVGEITRVAEDTGLFQGYFDNPNADQSKYRGGVYHSGDLGHILVREGTRFLFFDGRTDDWIRKDGENFSAQQVARLVQEHPDVQLAAAYGVPCAVSDELVMVAVKLRDGARFDPKTFFDFCEGQVSHGSMDRKWFPDFLRLVDEFEYTQTQKVLVRNLKKVHFCRRRLPHEQIYWRRREDKEYRPLTPEEYERLREDFAKAEKLELLDR
jgi:fatty-acyl-CoA synthase